MDTPVKSTIGKQRKQRANAPKKEKRIAKRVSEKTQEKAMVSCGVTGHFILADGSDRGLVVRIAGPPELMEAFERVWYDFYGEDEDEAVDMPPGLRWVFEEVGKVSAPDGTLLEIDHESEGRILLATHVPALTPDRVWIQQEAFGDDLQVTLPFDPVKYGEHYAKMGFLGGAMVKSAKKQ